MNDINIEIVQPELTLEFPTNPIGSTGPGSSQDLSSVLAQGSSAGGQTITDLNELVVQIVRGLAGLQLIAGTDLTLSAANIASIIGPSIASIISNEGQVMIDGDRITIQHSGEVRFSASLLDLLGTTRMRNLPAAVNPDEPVRKQEYDAALANKADLVGGVIPTSQIPTIAITEFLGAVANQAAMLLLTGERGDWCIRQDESMAFVLIAEDATLIANWVAIPHPQSPVLSVNGQTGVIVLSTSNIGEGSNLYWTQTRFDNAFAAKTTDGLTEGATNLYFTNARVLATTLANLDTSTNAVITSGDTVLVAFGKLQKQITDLTSYADAKVADAITNGVTTVAPSQNKVYNAHKTHENAWQTLAYAPAFHIAANVTAADVYWHNALGQASFRQGVAVSNPPVFKYIKSSDFVSAVGLTPKLRIKIHLFSVNDAAPGRTLVVGLYPCSGPSTGSTGGVGVRAYAAGTVVTGSEITFTTPAADTFTTDMYSTTFDIPVDGLYAIATSINGALAANSGVHVISELQFRFE